MRTIQTRHRAFEMKVGTNLRHVDRVAIVCRISQILGPRVSDLRGDTTRRTQAERSQQSVITRRRARLTVSNRTEPAEWSREVDAVVRVVARAQRRVATRNALPSCNDLRGRRRVDVRRTNQVISSRTRVADL